MGLSHSPGIVTSGLIYALDAANTRSYSGSGNTANGLVGGIDGSLINGVGFGTTNSGSFNFDGTNDYIELGASIQNYPVFTTSIWINYNFFDGSHRSPLGDNSQNSSYHILFLGGVFYLGFSSSSFTQVNHNNISVNTWYNFVVTKNSSDNVSFYQNCILLGTTNVPVGRSVSINKIGRGYVYDNAKISNVSFYNRALSAREIKQNYNALKRRYSL
jgi:hypothetical protein